MAFCQDNLDAFPLITDYDHDQPRRLGIYFYGSPLEHQRHTLEKNYHWLAEKLKR